MDLVVAHHGMDHAFKIMNRMKLLQTNLCDTSPMSFFNEAGHGSFNQVRAVGTGVLQEFRELMADNVLKSAANKLGETAIGRANFSIEGHSNQHVVERINQIAITLLRALDDRKELAQLL